MTNLASKAVFRARSKRLPLSARIKVGSVHGRPMTSKNDMLGRADRCRPRTRAADAYRSATTGVSSAAARANNISAFSMPLALASMIERTRGGGS